MNDRLSIFLFFIFLFFCIYGCSKTIVIAPAPGPTSLPSPTVTKSPPAVSKKTDRKERPYAVNGKWYIPVASVNAFREQGICSWYGPDFHGKLTSSGEIYDQFAFTAAHRILPFNTQVRVKNPSNNKEIIVRINDRGPFLKERILDLSYIGAKELGVIGPGTTLIELEALGILEEIEENGRKVTRLVQQVDFQKGNFSVQLGAFKDLQNALNLKDKLQNEYAKVEISEMVRLGETFFRVRVAQCNELQEAIRVQKQLEEKGFFQALVVTD